MKCGALFLLLAFAAIVNARVPVGSADPEGDLWVVLVAGSYTWFNYRHQADVCHAYQIVHSHGVPDDHIIVMMYDDLATSKQNPTPGQVINRPNGPDVYKGVPKDYIGMDVTPENFLKVLSGDAAGLEGVGSGKVVKSGPNDRVFVNLVDHGAPGIFAFPHTFMHAKDFSSTILQMKKDNKFKEMYVYMEACESGSMFQNNFPDDIGFYALSASNATESSYACYMDTKRGTFLGDVFSIKWMEDSDREQLTKETLLEQFNIVQKSTTTSHVEQWGELSLDSNTVSTILGSKTPEGVVDPVIPSHDPCLNSSVSSPDVPVAILQSNIDNAANAGEAQMWQKQLIKLHENRNLVNSITKKLAIEVTGDGEMAQEMTTDKHHVITQWDCYEQAADAYNENCFNLGENPYALRAVHTLVNLCEHGHTASDIIAATEKVCTHPHITEIH
ncbi:hypothetical protein SK128_008479 [Halocaridina rubra]|uniref:legumain n=1 Tax=Halocaridina rubra TaxID=373956 RepID=A0AAN9A3D3_HALRR